MIKTLFYRLLFFLQFHRLMRFLLRDKVLILAYHGFTDQVDHEGIENHQRKHLWIGRFETQLRYLKKYHRVIPLEEAVEALRSGKKLSPYVVAITFDDGYRSNYTLAFPLLKHYRLPATIFLATRFVNQDEFFWADRIEYAVKRSDRLGLEDGTDRRACEKNLREGFKRIPQESRGGAVEALEERLGQKLSWETVPEIYRPVNWDEVREMQASGLVSFGSHTHTHLVASRCQLGTFETELALSREIIERETSRPVRLFCYPDGNMGDFNGVTHEAVQKAGYLCALTTVPGAVSPRSNLYELKRMGAPAEGGIVEFAMYLYGIAGWLTAFKKFVAGIKT